MNLELMIQAPSVALISIGSGSRRPTRWSIDNGTGR